jgi:pimeloyl-ACP methyl ester carboxylesterase
VSAETSAEIARELASATLATVPLAGHLAPLEQPEEIARRTLDFINGL